MTISYVSDADDILHDIEEMDRKNKGILTDVKRFSIRRAARILGVVAADDEGLQRLASIYALSVEDISRALTEPLPVANLHGHAMARFSAVVLNNTEDAP